MRKIFPNLEFTNVSCNFGARNELRDTRTFLKRRLNHFKSMTSILNPVAEKEEDNGTINRRYFVFLGDENREEENSPFNWCTFCIS